jgi:hypothetical protein
MSPKFVVFLAALLWPLAPGAGLAEVLPTKGIFKGYYHCSRAGVGRFDYFLVPPELLERFAPFDGKYIQVEVLGGRQPVSPGPAIIEHVGEIQELGPRAIRVEFKTQHIPAKGDYPVFAFKNQSNATVELDGAMVAHGVARLQLREGRNLSATLLGVAYTDAQLGFEARPVQPLEFIQYAAGAKAFYHIGRIRLNAGESAAFVGLPLPEGNYELAASASYWRGQVYESVKAWTSLDLRLPPGNAARFEPMRAESQVEYRGDWIIVKGRFFTPDHVSRHVLVQPDPRRDVFPGYLKLIDVASRLMPTDVEHIYPDDPWVLKTVGPQGLPFEFRVRPGQKFTAETPSKLQLDLVSSAGLERIVLVKDLSDRPRIPLPPWGESVDGVRLRARTSQQRYRSGEPIRVALQVEAEQGKAQMFRTPMEPVTVEIDDAKVRLLTSIPAGYVLSFPYPAEIELHPVKSLSEGKHRLRVTLTAEGPELEGGNGIQFRSFRGRLASDAVEFEIRD